ncbi:IS1595 family transposase [Herbaspirillum sp. SJZ099]|uniref:IS1595 family transposase n=1 Tax=Herbaspirillum sp. SJZ099 TaxID=2572916 RepID=UPI0011A2048E|nr:IS1595 family transposase [Herbaspirillum sp. SJZ099]TWC62359.1 transposase-like zinc ribbon protein [Herbaspirillum sp. SJZ099]
MVNLTNPIFSDESLAIAYLESIRWRLYRYCPKCGETERTSPTKSKNHRPGLYYCNSCKSTFTVTVGTLFHRSKVPINKWLLVFHLMAASKKGISALQIQRMIEVSYNTAWFMCHRVREAMTPTETEKKKKLGGRNKPVEVDETYWGNNGKLPPGARGFNHKMKIVSMVERDGKKRSIHVPDVKAKTIMPILQNNVSSRSRLMTDEAAIYQKAHLYFASHESVNHRMREYARGDVTTNTVEGSFSLVKRSLYGTFHQVSEKHLQRYLQELDFKWNTRRSSDTKRFKKALKAVSNKRLTGAMLMAG